MTVRFRNRAEAGVALGRHLDDLSDRADVVVLGLPRGGVEVAFEVARALHAPLDVFVVRKLGVPGHEELAMGAIASGGVRVVNDDVVTTLGIPSERIDAVAAGEAAELARRERAYRGDRAPAELRGKTVVLVDDGVATGSTMRAAARAVRTCGPARVIIAVPTAPPDTCAAMRAEADDVVCDQTPWPFHAVGLSYDDFRQTTDERVRELLAST